MALRRKFVLFQSGCFGWLTRWLAGWLWLGVWLLWWLVGSLTGWLASSAGCVVLRGKIDWRLRGVFVVILFCIGFHRFSCGELVFFIGQLGFWLIGLLAEVFV